MEVFDYVMNSHLGYHQELVWRGLAEEFINVAVVNDIRYPFQRLKFHTSG